MALAGEVKVVVIGDSGAGKTSLVLSYCRNEFSTSVASTIGAAFLKHTVTLPEGDELELQIWDTAGQERYQALAPMYYRGAKICLIVFDITVPNALDNVKKWYQGLVEGNHDSNKVVALVGNKIDLEDDRKISKEEATACANEINAAYFETSAKLRQGITQMFQTLSVWAIEKNLPEIIDNSDMELVAYSPQSGEESGGCC